MKKAIIHGCYNTTNFGDLLLLELLAKYLKDKWSIDSFTYKVPAGIELEYCQVSSSPLDWLKPTYAIYGGGGYLEDDGGSKIATKRLLRYLIPAKIWNALNVKYAIIAPGGGPDAAPVGAARIKWLCEHASHISIRDELTINFLRTLGIERTDIVRTADYALNITHGDIPAAHKYNMSDIIAPQHAHKKIIGFHLEVIYKDMAKFEEFCSLAFLKNPDFLKKFHLVFFYDYMTENVEEVKKRLNQIEGLSYSIQLRMNHWKTADFLSQCHAVLTTKLHVSIVSAAFGVPIFGFSFHEKTARFFREIGRSEYQRMWSEDMSCMNDWMDQLAADNPTAWNLSEEHMSAIKLAAARNNNLIDAYVQSRGN